MSDNELSPDAVAWIDRFAIALGVPAPSESEFADLLALAAVAAHSSHRQAAPVACWLAGSERSHAGGGPRAGSVAPQVRRWVRRQPVR